MKNLRDYINESLKPADGAKTFNFNLTGIDNAKETIESLATMCDEKGFKHSETETSFSIILVKSDDLKEKVAGIQDVLQQYVEIIRKDSKNASNETYAQKTKAVEKMLDEMVSYIDDVNDDEEE